MYIIIMVKSQDQFGLYDGYLIIKTKDSPTKISINVLAYNDFPTIKGKKV